MGQSQNQRWIAHCDMDAFFAAVEQRDNPKLRGKPVLVAHPGARSVVSTASYEARPYGVGSAMSLTLALKKCPQAIVAPPRYLAYQEASEQIMDIFRTYTPCIEPLSLDEAFLDLSGTERLFGPPEVIAEQIRAKVHQKTGLKVSIGLAPNKFVAKVASDIKKPDALVVVHPQQMSSFLNPLPIERLWGVGKKTAQRLRAAGYRTFADVAKIPVELLCNQFGEALGQHIAALAIGKDDRVVVSERCAKSIGHERTLSKDIVDPQAAKPWLREAADEIGRRLRKSGSVACGLRVKLKTASFRLQTRQQKLPAPTQTASELYAHACDMLSIFDWREPYRLVGMAAFDLRPQHSIQASLFDPVQHRKHHRLESAVDEIQDRFGHRSLTRATAISEPSPQDLTL